MRRERATLDQSGGLIVATITPPRIAAKQIARPRACRAGGPSRLREGRLFSDGRTDHAQALYAKFAKLEPTSTDARDGKGHDPACKGIAADPEKEGVSDHENQQGGDRPNDTGFALIRHAGFVFVAVVDQLRLILTGWMDKDAPARIGCRPVRKSR